MNCIFLLLIIVCNLLQFYIEEIPVEVSPKGSYPLQFVAVLAFSLQFVAILALYRLCMFLTIWELTIVISSGIDSFTNLQSRQMKK